MMIVMKKTTTQMIDEEACSSAVRSVPQGRHYMYLPEDFQAMTFLGFMGCEQEALIPESAPYAYRVDRDAKTGIEVTRIRPANEPAFILVEDADRSYPHKCPKCSGPAYIGAFKVDCKAKCH